MKYFSYDRSICRAGMFYEEDKAGIKVVALAVIIFEEGRLKYIIANKKIFVPVLSSK